VKQVLVVALVMVVLATAPMIGVFGMVVVLAAPLLAVGEEQTATCSASSWVPPILDADGKVGSGFGMRENPVLATWMMHNGVDLTNTRGTPIYAASAGTVVTVSYGTANGYWLKINHGGGIHSVYLHMDGYSDIYVKEGDQVRAGQHIANEGGTGRVTSPHLHFEIHVDGKPVDPVKFYAERGADIVAKPAEGTSTSCVSGSSAVADLADLPHGQITVSSKTLPTAVELAKVIKGMWPQIQTIGGWRECDTYREHCTGRTLDIMMPNSGRTSADVQLGNEIKDWLIAMYKDKKLPTCSVIWRQTSYQASSFTASKMSDRGSWNENHMNHVHVTLAYGYGSGGCRQPGVYKDAKW
jgi:biotin carboxyl carrier protein